MKRKSRHSLRTGNTKTRSKTIVSDNKETEPDDMMNVEDMEWYKEEAAKDTPGKTLRFYRKLKGMTQPELAAVLGTTKQFISNLENDRKPISRIMAKKLSEIDSVQLKS